MSPEERIDIINDRLLKKFSPTKLEVIDDSHKHVGHAGSKDGAGHYTVIICSDELKKLSRVAAHRAVYDCLKDLIPHEIHALSIVVGTSTE